MKKPKPHPKPKFPPNPARISRLDLHIVYVHSHWRHTMSTATLTWVLPTTRVDGTAFDPTEIASVAVFDTGSITPAVAIGSVAGPGVTFTTDILTVGDHGFTVEVIDTTGHVSAASNVANVTVPAVLAVPSPATALVAVLNP